MDIVKIDKIVCIETIEDINFRSPPNSLANAYADDAVGMLANNINRIILSFSTSNNKQTKYIIIGNSINLLNEVKTNATFVLPIEERCKPTPTDKSPKGSAAELKIDNVFSISRGKLQPITLKVPPKKQAKISGFLIIEPKKELKVILFFGT